MTSDEHKLWEHAGVECVMISCCAGAELQLRRGRETILRELYPSKSDLYDRARDLERGHRTSRSPEPRDP